MSVQPDLLRLEPKRFPTNRVKVDFRKLLSSMGQALTHGTFAFFAPEPATAAGSAVKAGAAIFGAVEAFEADAPLEVRAWYLLRSALANALGQLLGELHERRGPFQGDLEHLDHRFDLLLAGDGAVIDADFLDNPRTLKLLSEIRRVLEDWLATKVGLSVGDSRSLALRLDTHLAPALRAESRAHRDYYKPLYDHFEDRFAHAAEMEWDWERNRLALVQQFDDPVFEETFSLRQVYVPLRAYHEERAGSRSRHSTEENGKPPRRIVRDLETAVTAWLEGKDGITEPICFVGGGPGSGKSTFARRLATKLSEENQRVLFIELQDFDMEEKIESAIGTYYRRSGAFIENPVGQVQFASVDRPLLLIFDGLDELSEPSDYADRETANFVSRLDRALRTWNTPGRRVLALITGRPPVIQEHTSGLNLNDRQRLWVLPYVIEEEERRGLVGSAARLRHDQRTTWWRGYARAKGLDGRSVPDALLNPEFSELTAEPLLCYLVVLSRFHERAGLGESRNLIYQALYESVVERRHAGGAKLAAAKAIRDTVFDRLMEAIAVAAWWYSEGRIASVEQIRAACGDDQELHEALDPFLETGHRPARLFAAFYFRAAEGRRHGGNAFEFTHKSFSEYLTARRLVREITEIHNDLAHSRRYSHENALEDWTHLTAPAPMTMDLLRFVRDELALRLELRRGKRAPETIERARAELKSWQETLTALFNRQLREGLPLKSLAGDHLRSVERQARNAEEALLAAVNACARVTKEPVAVEWPHRNSAGAMLHRLRGQRNLHQPIVALACLGRLPLVRQLLLSQDLGDADLSNSDLTDSCLSSSDLSGADLKGATLTGAEIILAYLAEADFSRADLSQATIGLAFGSGAKFTASILKGAELNHTDFSRADLSRTDLREADFTEADLTWANLDSADLTGADLTGADLRGARNLTKEQISSAADITGAKLPDYLK